MTRENKLALVVGFALILFVGILISDHFSVVRQQEAAHLGSGQIVDPTLASHRSSADLIDLLATNVTTTGDPNARMGSAMTPPLPPMQASASGQSIQMGGPAAGVAREPQASTSAELPGFAPLQPEEVVPLNVKYHDVRQGETLMAICREHYQDGNLANALAKFNKIDDPRTMKAGRRLIIPDPTEIGAKPHAMASAAAETTKTPKSAPPKQPKTYTIKQGDSLATIAQRVYGSKTKWTRIYEQNRDVIDDPDNVRAGTVIKL